MPVDLNELCDDLEVETAALDGVLSQLTDEQWEAPTPAPGWAVRDQVSHLAYFDGAQLVALETPSRFAADRAGVGDDVDAFTDKVAKAHRHLPPAELLAWFGQARRDLTAAFRTLDPSARVPWYGPGMSAASAVTARIMETRAHGTDIADAVDVVLASTPALRHVAHIGVRTLPNSYRARGLDVPDTPVRVGLEGPSGERWTWGPAEAADVVTGPALDFCLVVTQRRHVSDTDLVVSGPGAQQWVSIAQAFAGPPGAGRQAGQMRKR